MVTPPPGRQAVGPENPENPHYVTPSYPSGVTFAPGMLANDSGVDGSTLSAILVAAPAHGMLILDANGSFTYPPEAGYLGTDSFTYKVNDGVADSGTATVSLTVVSGEPLEASQVLVGRPETLSPSPLQPLHLMTSLGG